MKNILDIVYTHVCLKSNNKFYEYSSLIVDLYEDIFF